MSRKPPANDDFLGRWSKRKAEARRDPEPEPEPDDPAPPAADGPPKSDAEILEELGLPDPETLEPGSDFSAFMKAAVPDHLRRIALRKLWGTNPVLANLDGMIDYGEDYTDAATVVANLQSAFKAGQGYAEKFAADEKAREEAEAKARAEAGSAADVSEAGGEPAAETADSEGAGDENPVAGMTEEPAQEREDAPGEASAAQSSQPGDSAAVHTDHAVKPRRRMSFRFDDV